MEANIFISVFKIKDLSYKIPTYYESLSGDERLRVTKFKFTKDREKFIIVRGYLRSILSNFILEPPSDIKFIYSLNRKPIYSEGGIYFNVSHSKNTACIAISKDVSVGIDIEDRRNMTHINSSIFFHEEEIRYLERLPISKKNNYLLWLWTRKEAFCKTTGIGITPAIKEVNLLKDKLSSKQISYTVKSVNISKSFVSICYENSYYSKINLYNINKLT